MFKHFSIIGALLLVTPSVALSAPPSLQPACDPQDSRSCVQPLLEGEAAPFTGQLLTPRRAAKLAVKAGQCKERIRLETTRISNLLLVDLEAERAKRTNDAKHHQLQLDLMKARLVEASQREWYEHPVLVAAFAVAATSLVYVGAVKTVEAL